MQKECARQDQMNHAIANSVSGGDAEGAYEVVHFIMQKIDASREIEVEVV